MTWETIEGKKCSISETTETSLMNQGQTQKPKGELQERPSQIPDHMITIVKTTHPNGGNK